MFSSAILDEFGVHTNKMRAAARARREAVQLRSAVYDTGDAVAVNIQDTLGVRLPNDRWAGCTNLRTLRCLLQMIDDRGFERSPHQMKFHSSFERCVSRVVYKTDWATSRPAIMRYEPQAHARAHGCTLTLSKPRRHNKWDRCSSEVMIR